MNITFNYINCQPLLEHELVARRVIEQAHEHLKLPPDINIVFKNFGARVYGGVDLRDYRRIGLNTTLPLREMVDILIHELIHVEQRHRGVFNISSDGWYYWNGRPITNRDPELLPVDEYKNLPWETDVSARLRGLRESILKQKF